MLGGWFVVHCFLVSMLTDVLYPKYPLPIVSKFTSKTLLEHKIGSLERIPINQIIKNKLIQIKHSFLRQHDIVKFLKQHLPFTVHDHRLQIMAIDDV